MSERPPVPVGLPLDREAFFDPSAALTALREHRPISEMVCFPDEQRGWLVTGHELARKVFSDSRFSAAADLTAAPIPDTGPTELLNELRNPGTFLRMDAPEHTRLRKMLTGSFTVKRMRDLEPAVERIVAEQLDELEAAGPPADLVANFALPVPSTVICELLGVPAADRSRFEFDSKQLLRLDIDPADQLAAHLRLREYIRELSRVKAAAPAEDLISDLAARSDLDEEELVGMAFLLLLAGHETTMNMFGLGTFALLRHPQQWRALRDDPELIPGAVEELLRYLSIIHVGPVRVAQEDVDLDGFTVRANEHVFMSLPAANRDADHFGPAEDLDVTRAATGHLAFGHGIHQCLGQQLARIEMRIGFAALLRRFPELRLAIPAEEVRLRQDMTIYGVHDLPVAW